MDSDLLAFILHFLKQFWIASRLACNFYEAKAGLLSVASTALSPANVAVVDSGEVGRSIVIPGIIMALGHCLEVHMY
jgi:hypothetical protein